MEEEEGMEEEDCAFVRGEMIATDCRGASCPHNPSRIRPSGWFRVVEGG